jgi:hypothetical protein
MENRWISGNDLLRHLNRKEILDAIDKKTLSPYDKATGKEIVDSDEFLVESITGKGESTFQLPTEKEVVSKLKSMNKPKDALLSRITLENVTDFDYSIEQVDTLLKPPHTAAGLLVYITGKQFKKVNPNWTTKEATQAIIEHFKDSNIQPLTERQIQRIIKPLGFKQGKAGRPSKK